MREGLKFLVLLLEERSVKAQERSSRKIGEARSQISTSIDQLREAEEQLELYIKGGARRKDVDDCRRMVEQRRTKLIDDAVNFGRLDGQVESIKETFKDVIRTIEQVMK